MTRSFELPNPINKTRAAALAPATRILSLNVSTYLMPKTIIDSESAQEIRAALAGLSGARATAEVDRWAKVLNCHRSRIYEVTKDLRPPRKARSDKGKRRVDPMQHEGMRFVFERCATNKLDPDQAIEMARANGHDVPVSLGTTRRYLRAAGLNRRAVRRAIRPHRRWEAPAPGDIYQFDISGVKERWIDLKTRRILNVSPLEVSKNHPNTKINRIPIWKFVLVDDYSRFRYVRFVACAKADSGHVIDFLLGAFRALGVPKVLYTDNDAIIVSRRMQRAAEILNRAFTDSGGFRLDQHLPGNPQATGKVEVSHQLVEKYERYIGAMDRPPTLDDLNIFTERLCEKLNWTTHRVTGEMPAIRFRAGNASVRVPPAETLNAAFKSVEFEREIRADLSFSYEGVVYQLPRNAVLGGERNPFVDWVGQKVRIIWPTDANYFVAVGLNGTSYELDRREAAPDRAGQFKTPAESIGQRTAKELRESAKANRAARKAEGTEIIVPGIDRDFELPAAAGAVVMPRKRIDPSLAEWANAAGDAMAPSLVTGAPIDYWTAAQVLVDEGHFERNDAGQISQALQRQATALAIVFTITIGISAGFVVRAAQTININAGDDFQAKTSSAQCGDTVLVQAGAAFPTSADNGFVWPRAVRQTIRSSCNRRGSRNCQPASASSRLMRRRCSPSKRRPRRRR
jgi:hypothetical protein